MSLSPLAAVQASTIITGLEAEEREALRRAANTGGYGGEPVDDEYRLMAERHALCYRSTGRLRPMVYQLLLDGGSRRHCVSAGY